MVSVGGLASGLDTQGIIQQLLELERRPISQLERRVQQLTADQGRYTALQPGLNAVSAAAAGFSDRTALLRPQASSSNQELVGVTATNDAISASYDIRVTQLAQAGRRASQGFADTNTTGIAASGGTFSIRAGNSGSLISVSVDASTTMRDLVNAINAQNGDITASIVNDGSAANANRLVLTSDQTGRASDIQVVTNDSSLQFDTAVIEDAFADASNDAAYTGTVTSSGTYTGTNSKSFIVEIMSTGAVGAATYRFSSDGGVTFDDNGGAGFSTSAVASALGSNTEGVDIAFSDSGTLTAGDRFTVDVTAPVLQQAQDAVFTLNGIQQSRSSNTVTDAVEGLTFDLNSASDTASSRITISRNSGAIISRITDFVTAYNDILGSIRDQQQFDSTTNTGGPLLGDPTANRIVQTLRGLVTRRAPGVVNGPKSLVDLGITTNASGNLAINTTRLNELLDEDREAVLQVLSSAELSSNDALNVAGRTSNIPNGTYAVAVTTAAERATISAGGAFSGPIAADEVLTFRFSADRTADVSSESVFTVTLEAGDSMGLVIERLNSAFATQGVGLSARDEGGTLRIDSTDYGADVFFGVRSSLAAGAGTSQIGSTELTDEGVDIQGSIAGVPTTGTGAILTGTDRLEGLTVEYTGTATGNVGVLTLTTGLGSTFQNIVDGLVSGSQSVLQVRNSSIQDRIDRLNDQIVSKNEQVARTQQRLEAQFASLEVTLAQLQSQSTFLNNQLAQLAGASTR